jgi:hypothetical protein
MGAGQCAGVAEVAKEVALEERGATVVMKPPEVLAAGRLKTNDFHGNDSLMMKGDKTR